MLLTIMIPFYNEEEVIDLTHKALTAELAKLEDVEIELVYVNDGSRDKTLDKMRAIAEVDNRVKYISFSRNFGKESAMLAGLEHSTGDAVIIMDGDLQNPPFMIPLMLDKYYEGYDMVNGKRTREGDKMTSSFFAKMFYKVANHLMDVTLTDGISDFRLLSRKAVDALVSLREYNRFSKGLFSWVGFKTTTINYENVLREAGETKFNFKKSMNYAIEGILSFNDKPLRLVFNIGLACIAVAGLYILWLLYSYITNPETAVSGYFTTIFTVVLFGGVQLVSIGVLGEYIGKIFYEVKGRPHYLIGETNIDK